MVESISGKQTIADSRRDRTDMWLVMGILVLGAVAVALIWAEFGDVLRPRGPISANELNQTTLTDVAGIRVVLVALTAGGGMIDIRYQVTDPDKAFGVHDENDLPTITDTATETELWRAEHHGAHVPQLHTGVMYSYRILNAGGIIEQGNTVTLRIGGVVLENVPVQ